MNRRTFLLGAAAVPVVAALPEAEEAPGYVFGVDHGMEPDRYDFTIWSFDGVVWRTEGLPSGYTVVSSGTADQLLITANQDPPPPE